MDKLASRGITSFYAIDVDYNYTINTAPNTTLPNAVNWVNGNVNGRGIIFNPDSNLLNSIGAANFNLNPGIYGGVMAANRFGLQLTADQGAAGLPGSNGNIYNMVAGNPLQFGAGSNYSFSLNATGVFVHEVGHNNAATNLHNTGNYEYNQSGTQSNTNPTPSKTNTKNTINDATNRTTL